MNSNAKDPGVMVLETASSRRRRKGDTRIRTRAKLLEAAREFIREKGYEHTTMEESLAAPE